MENNVTIENDNDDLIIREIAKEHLASAAKWAKFLAIFGFSMIGICILIMFVAAVIGTTAANIGVLLLYIVGACIYVIPLYYLYDFALKAQEALHSNNSDTLTDSLDRLKSAFKFWGIMTIIIVSLYVIIILFALIFWGFN